MKKLITVLICFAFTANFTYAQNHNDYNFSGKKIDYYKKYISELEKEAAYILNETTTFCNDYWELNSSEELTYVGEGKTVVEELNNDKFIITQETLGLGEDDSVDKSKFIAYFHGIPNYNSEFGIDSSLFFINFGGSEALFLKNIYYYENTILTYTKIFMNMDLIVGFPSGFVEISRTNYKYDNENFLIDEANYSADIFGGTGLLIMTDSIHYNNKPNGQHDESYTYQIDAEDNIIITQKTEYYYDDQDRIIEYEYYVNPEDWFLSTQTRFEYLDKIEVIYNEYSEDGGLNWIPTDRDSTYFTNNLKFSLPSRQVYQSFDEEWKTQSIVVSRDCSGTSKLNEQTEIDLNAWFVSDDIELEFNYDFTKSTISLFNMDGKLMFNKIYDNLPQKIKTQNLHTGIYLLKISSESGSKIKKLIKL